MSKEKELERDYDFPDIKCSQCGRVVNEFFGAWDEEEHFLCDSCLP